jgi:hypothetical protein
MDLTFDNLIIEKLELNAEFITCYSLILSRLECQEITKLVKNST